MSDFFEQLFGGMGGGRRTSTRSRRASSEPKEREVNVSIDVWTAILGGEVTVSTPSGKFRVKIEPGTQPGKKVRMRDKGGTLSDGSNIDLILVFNVSIPTNLTERQRDFIEKARLG